MIVANRKKRADHRVQDAEQAKAQAKANKEARQARKLMEMMGAKFCALCRKSPATAPIESFDNGLLRAQICEKCSDRSRWEHVQKKFNIVPAVKQNLGDKLIAALKKS